MPQNDQLNLPRELVSCIASLLDKSDITRCVRVSKLWLQVFTPELWYAFDDGQTKSWGQTSGEELKDLDWLEPTLKNYGHHIRHLTINSARTVEILASHLHICQDLICVAVPRMRRFKLPATYTRRSKQGWGTVLGAWPQMHQTQHPRLDPDEADLDKMIKAVIVDPRFGDGAFQLSGKWLTDNDEAEFLHVQMLWLLLLKNSSTFQRLEISDSVQLTVAPFRNTATLADVLSELPVLRHLTLPWPNLERESLMATLPRLEHLKVQDPIVKPRKRIWRSCVRMYLATGECISLNEYDYAS